VAEPRLWRNMTVKDIREALNDTRTVLIPVGCVEQHGYHLPTCTDYVIADTVAARASAQTGALVVPPVMYTYSGGELPGTINISPAVVSMYLAEIVRDLARQGWKNLIIVLGHGGSENDAGVEGAMDIFLRTHPDRSDLNLAIYRFWKFSEAAQEAYEDRDYHAGYFETSMMMVAAPELVRSEYTLDTPELVAHMREHQDGYQSRFKNVDHEAVLPHIHQNPETEVGVIGDPTSASREYGERLFDEAVEGLVQLINAADEVA